MWFWENYPCVSKPKYIEDLYVSKFAFHFYELIVCVFFHRQNRDFPEMILHHITTIALIVISFNVHYMVPGAIIMLVHDTSDIFILLCRMAKELAGDLTIAISWVVMFLTWCYLRLYYYPDRIIKVFFYEMWTHPHFFV